MSDFTHELTKLLNEANRIAITSHINPDPDAIGSMLGVYHFLAQYYPEKHLRLVNVNPADEAYDFLPGVNVVEWNTDIADVIPDVDLAIFLDGNGLHRFSDNLKAADLTEIKSICIDHHPKEFNNFDLELIQPEAISCAELVYKHVITATTYLSNTAAEALAYGIMGDSGTFSYITYKNSEALQIVKVLIDSAHLNLQKLNGYLKQIGETEFEIYQQLIANTQLTTLSDGTTLSYSYLPLSYLQVYNRNTITRAKNKYQFDILRQISGYPWGFVVVPRKENTYAVSFRSTPNAPRVDDLARSLGGGGHELAASGYWYLNTENELTATQVAEKVVKHLEEQQLRIFKL